MSQMERILYIDKSIRKRGQYITVREIAEHFEVSERQVKRDIEYMRNRMDAPIVWDSSRRVYLYEKEYNDLAFAGQDYVLSYLALQSILKSKQYLPVYEDNIFSAMEVQVPADYRELSNKITYQLPQVDKISLQFFEDICTSMKDRNCISIKYTNSKGISSERCIEVHHLINYASSWYIIAWENEKEELRTFNLSRIEKLSLSKNKFIDHGKKFDATLQEFLSGSFGIFHGTKTQNVKIRFYDTAARIVQTQTWHEKQKITQNDSYLELEFPAADFTEVLGKILSFGHLAKPAAPEELVTLWKNEIKKLNENL